MKTFLLLATVLCLGLFLAGCGGDQARAAANIRVLAIATAKSGDLTPDQALLLQGILCEADAIRESTEPEARPTIDPAAPPATMAAQAQEHAGTVRTIGAQVADSTWTWVLGAITAAGTLLLGGVGGGMVVRGGSRSLLNTAIEFGSAALAALKKANPPAAAAVVAEQVAKQVALGQRDAIRAAVAAAPPSPLPPASAAVADSAPPASADLTVIRDALLADLADAKARLECTEKAGHKATEELRRLWAENLTLREAQEGALERKPKKGT